MYKSSQKILYGYKLDMIAYVMHNWANLISALLSILSEYIVNKMDESFFVGPKTSWFYYNFLTVL